MLFHSWLLRAAWASTARSSFVCHLEMRDFFRGSRDGRNALGWKHMGQTKKWVPTILSLGMGMTNERQEKKEECDSEGGERGAMDGSVTACTDGQIAPLDCLAPCVGTGNAWILVKEHWRMAPSWTMQTISWPQPPALGQGAGRALQPPALWGPISGKPKGCEGKGQADFKGDVDLVWNLTPLEFKFLPGLHMAKWPCLLPSSPAGAANTPVSNMGVPGFLSWWSSMRYPKICFRDPRAAPKEYCSGAVGIWPSHWRVSVQAALLQQLIYIQHKISCHY